MLRTSARAWGRPQKARIATQQRQSSSDLLTSKKGQTYANLRRSTAKPPSTSRPMVAGSGVTCSTNGKNSGMSS